MQHVPASDCRAGTALERTDPERAPGGTVALKGPGDKVLSSRLKELEAQGLLVRQVDAGPPVRVSYELTRAGREFGELAQAIERWGRELVQEVKPRRR